MSHLFILGSAPALSQAEIQAVLGINTPITLAPDVLSCVLDNNIIPQDLINILGGTVKIASIEKTISDKNKILGEVCFLLERNAVNKKIIYGLSAYGNLFPGNLKEVNRKLKIKLEEKGIKCRFILPSAGNVLSSVQITKEKITEILLVCDKEKITIGKTLVVQDFEDWGKRDYGRPFASPQNGMLPPKVARMMVNIAVGNNQQTIKNPQPVTRNSQPVILDPFCGVGTIGAESLLRGCWSINSDQDKEMADKTEKNLTWLCKNYDLLPENYQVYQSDAVKISSILSSHSVDAVVTEPYLGPIVELKNKVPVINHRQRLTPGKIENILKGLEKMYHGALKEWLKVLKIGGRTAIVVPVYRYFDKDYSMKNLLDTCEKLGYNLIEGPFEYFRPQAIVKRQILILEKKLK